MTKREMIERSLKALAEYDSLPPEEQWQDMIEAGIINEKGEVLFSCEKRDLERAAKEAAERAVREAAKRDNGPEADTKR
jgi:hypothetical protein